MKESKLALARLKNLLMQDKTSHFQGINRVLVGDIYSLLSCYFELDKENIRLVLSLDEQGEYCLSISANAKKIISPKLLEEC